jgi:hypothetical protein
LLWATFEFPTHSGFEPTTHWGDKAYQIGGESKYDFVQAGSFTERSDKFIQLANQVGSDGKTNFNYICDNGGYYEDDGKYYDPYYSTGSDGSATFIGEFLATVDWQLVGVWALVAWIYVALSFVGPWVFPPFAICIYQTGGDLETCSLGIWGNDYTNNQF